MGSCWSAMAPPWDACHWLQPLSDWKEWLLKTTGSLASAKEQATTIRRFGLLLHLASFLKGRKHRSGGQASSFAWPPSSRAGSTDQEAQAPSCKMIVLFRQPGHQTSHLNRNITPMTVLRQFLRQRLLDRFMDQGPMQPISSDNNNRCLFEVIFP